MFIDKMRPLIITRIFFALLGFSAVVTEIATLNERNLFTPANFFSYLTVQSNLLAVIILLLSAVALAGNQSSQRLAMLRGSSALNMIIVGIVFSLLLAGVDAKLTAVPWDNTVLHYIMPAFVALDWFVDLPKVHISFKQALIWMIFPAFYVIYSLVRGHIVSWYPYPFLNPIERGYMSVIITCGVIAIGSAGIIWMLAKFTGAKHSKNII